MEQPKKKIGRPALPVEERKRRKAVYAKKVYHKYSDRRKERVMCECGMTVSRAGLVDHKRRSHHKNNMAFLEKLKKECVVIQKK